MPFAIEPGATLPADRYLALERLAAQATPVTYRRVKPLVGRPEPSWLYAIEPGLDLASFPLQVGLFTAGSTAKAHDAAAALPGEIVDALREPRLFASVGTEPMPGALVLTRSVTRATTDEVDGSMTAAMTQVEARLTRNGTVVGVMQVNALQLDGSSQMPLASMLYSAAQGSRAAYIGRKFHEMFEGAAVGRAEGIDTETVSKRFILAPPLWVWHRRGASSRMPPTTAFSHPYARTQSLRAATAPQERPAINPDSSGDRRL